MLAPRPEEGVRYEAADGVLDAWEEYYFPGEPGRDLSQDFDSDTFTDLEEYLAETDPKDSGSTP